MAFFSRKPLDPLEAQMRELEAQQRALQRELEQLESKIALPPEKSSLQPIEILPPQPPESPIPPRHHTHSRRQLGVERRRIRRRVIAILILILIIALVIYRLTFG